MNRFRHVLASVGLLLFSSIFCAPVVLADIEYDLAIQQLGIASEEFVVLKNISNSGIELGEYWLQYFNEYNLTEPDVSGTSYQMPEVILPWGESILLLNGTAQNCGYAWVSDISISLKDSAGLLQLLKVSQGSGGAVNYQPGDQVSWASASAGFSTTQPPAITGVSAATKPVWYRDMGADIWSGGLRDDEDNCQLLVAAAPDPVVLGQGSNFPPATIVGVIDSNSGPYIAASNSGLAPPQISELLPNPASPKTDADDEFTELYNPNTKPFDLSWFKLETGTTTKRTYTFKPGEFKIPAKGFLALSSQKTGLSLTNSGGQVNLIEPFGGKVSQTNVYDTAKEGYAWVFANGKWYWSITATPGLANIVQAATGSSASGVGDGTVEGTSTISSAGTGGIDALGTAASAGQTPLHPAVLAGAGGLAVVYGLYEYRHDFANRLHQLQAYRAARRALRSKS